MAGNTLYGCVKCMICFVTCPNEVIRIGQSDVEILMEKCMACGEYNFTCPVWAYSLGESLYCEKVIRLNTLSLG
jgi:NAD-dependent dihydropyrimidine dehydrogenase PreA subunit